MISVFLRCAVRYVCTADGVRYCVRLAEVGLQIPSEMNLKEWAEHQDWARMDTGITASGMASNKEYFAVHLGAWHQSLRSRRAKKRREQFELVNTAAEALGLADDAWEVPPQTVLPAGPVIPVLESGQFRVTGTVHFRPLRPFHPRPEVPEGDELASKEAIEYEYPG